MQTRRRFFQRTALAGVASLAVPTALNVESTLAKQNRKRVLRIAHITDVHILRQTNAEVCLQRVVNELNAMKDKPDLIINTGDTVMDENNQTREEVEARWKVWNTIMAANKISMRSALGNHDVWYGPNEILDAEYKKEKRYGKQWAIEMLKLPNRYYSFESNGWQFVALD